jgi:phosphoribosyl-AMP cyclohydrolase
MEENRKKRPYKRRNAEDNKIVQRLPNPATEAKRQAQKQAEIDYREVFKNYSRTNVVGYDVENIENGIIAIKDGKKRHFDSHQELAALMVSADFFPEITAGFETEYPYEIFIVTHQNIAQEVNRQKETQLLLESILERDKVVFDPHAKSRAATSHEDAAAQLSINDSEVFSAEKLKRYDWAKLMNDANIDTRRAAEIMGVQYSSAWSAFRRIEQGTYTFQSNTRAPWTKLAKYLETLLGVRTTAIGKIDRIIEKITWVRDMMRQEAKQKRGAYIKGERLDDIANYLDEIILLNKPTVPTSIKHAEALENERN